MRFLSNLRSMIENWIINDALNTTNFTNINQDGELFVKKFGLNQLCLLEMFDESSKCFYGSEVAGFGFVLKSKSHRFQFGEIQYRVLSEISSQLKSGYGVQISSINQRLIVSFSCDVSFVDKNSVAAMLEFREEIIIRMQEGFVVECLDADELLNIIGCILYPNHFFKSDDSLVYQDDVFIRNQLVNRECSVQVLKNKLLYEFNSAKFTTSAFAVRQYSLGEVQPTIEQYQNFTNSKPFIFKNVIATMMAYKPIKKKQPKDVSKHEHKYQQKLQISHIFLEITDDTMGADEIGLKSKMQILDYHIELLNNRQLAALFFSLPINLGESTNKDIYDLRLSKSSNRISDHDLFPVIYNLLS